MEPTEVLGVVAHPGGVLVRRPELTVGVVRAVARPSALTLELLARTPREIAIRPAAAPRRLLPEHDEGLDLRVGWLVGEGRARWEYATSLVGVDSYDAPTCHRGVYVLPPLFDEMALVLAWPEIGFPETVITLPLPARDEVERAATSVWEGPREGVPVTEEFDRHPADVHRLDVAVEEGRSVAAPRVLHGSDQAVVVLNRLTAIGPLLSLEVLTIARGAAADAVHARESYPSGPPRPCGTPGPVTVAEVRGRTVHWLQQHDGSFILPRPDSGVLDLLVSWVNAGLAEVRVRVYLEGG